MESNKLLLKHIDNLNVFDEKSILDIIPKMISRFDFIYLISSRNAVTPEMLYNDPTVLAFKYKITYEQCYKYISFMVLSSTTNKFKLSNSYIPRNKKVDILKQNWTVPHVINLKVSDYETKNSIYIKSFCKYVHFEKSKIERHSIQNYFEYCKIDCKIKPQKQKRKPNKKKLVVPLNLFK